MTEAQLWDHVEACNVERVNAGLKAKLPLFTRSKDGLRSSILHVACRGTSADATDPDLASRRLAMIKSLLVARAHANAVDAAGLTPLDLAVCELGQGASDASPTLHGLQSLGFKTAGDAAQVQ